LHWLHAAGASATQATSAGAWLGRSSNHPGGASCIGAARVELACHHVGAETGEEDGCWRSQGFS